MTMIQELNTKTGALVKLEKIDTNRFKISYDGFEHYTFDYAEAIQTFYNGVIETPEIIEIYM